MASINQACGRMVARRTGTRRTPVSARMLTASALGGANNYSPLRPTAAPRRAGQTHPPSPPRTRGVRGGRQVVHPCGQHLNAHGRAIRSADQIQPPSKELLPFGGALPAECSSAHLSAAPGAHATAYWQGEAINNEHVARGDAPPTVAGIPVIPSAS